MKDCICKYLNAPSRVNSSGTKVAGKKSEHTDSLYIINECKITRDHRTCRIMNKNEIKSYRVLYDKRIILRGGEDTIPYGCNWEPSPTVVPPVCRVMRSVPEHMLFSQILPHMKNEEAQKEIHSQICADAESYITNVGDEDTREIDLVETDDESDMDYESENDDDRNFLVDQDEMLSEDELSFYRRLNNDTF